MNHAFALQASESYSATNKFGALALKSQCRKEQDSMASLMEDVLKGYVTRRICPGCGRVRPVVDFMPDKPRSPIRHLSSRCRDCRAAATKAYREQNRERLPAPQRAWNARNAERLKPYRAEHYQAHQELRRAQERARYAQEYAANPEKYIAKFHERRSRLLSNGGSYTPEEWEALCARYGSICLLCRRKVKLTVDHIVPISRGGTNDIDNLQPMCRSCNASKGNKIIDLRPQHEAFL